MVVLTEVFENLATTAARARGYEKLRQLVLPHPMETRSRAEIVKMTQQRFDEILGLLTAPG